MTAYEENREILVEALESYRDTPPDARKRRFVDWLMKRSLKDAQNDPEGKKYHNLIVLRYISSTRRAKKPICDALHIGRACMTTHKGNKVQCYEAVTDNAIDRLLVLAFGVDGVDWGSPSSSPQGQSVAAEYSQLVGLKYDLVAGLLAGMERNIRENVELSAEVRGGILAAVKTAQARLLLNAAFDLI